MKSNKSTTELMDEFLLYKNSLGYTYVTQSICLQRYVLFENNYYPGDLLSKRSINAYINAVSDSPGVLYNTVCVLREFYRYLKTLGYDEIYMIPHKTIRQQTPEPPYFFTPEEIEKFFKAADTIEPYSGFKGREFIIPAIFRLMYCCGIRCKEARMLKCSDVFLMERYFDVLQSKGDTSRRIYISDELAEYLDMYNQQIATIYLEREYFFPGYRNRPYLEGEFISGNFKRCWNKAFPEFPSKIYPRAYDFRHHFAYANINRWASQGLDVNVMLPYLMRYMGHQSIKHTLYYFHFVPEFYSTYNTMTETLENIIPEVPL